MSPSASETAIVHVPLPATTAEPRYAVGSPNWPTGRDARKSSTVDPAYAVPAAPPRSPM